MVDLSELQSRCRRHDRHSDSGCSLGEVPVALFMCQAHLIALSRLMMIDIFQDAGSQTTHIGSWTRNSSIKTTSAQSSSFSQEQFHDSFGHGRHHSHSQDCHGKPQENKLHKDPILKVLQVHGGNQPKIPGKKGESGSEVSDCGYGTQLENQESNSTSSNEEEPPQRLVSCCSLYYNY